MFYDTVCDEDDNEDFGDCSETSIPIGQDELYPGSHVSFHMAMVVLLTLVMTHRLSKECVGDLLSAIKFLMPKGNILVESSYSFFSYFNKYQSPVLKHFFCRSCSQSLPSFDSICPRCGVGHKVDYFLQFSITDQLQKLFDVPEFLKNLNYPQTRVKKQDTAYEDLYDGAVYTEAKRVLFSVGNWISLMWNTDGFAVFRNSLYSVWPFFLSVNELPPNMRHKKEFMLLGGLWFGTGKFDPNLFLKPIYEELSKLKNGFEFKIPSLMHTVKYNVALLCGTCDTPAKSTFFCHTAFNGLFGCLKCLTRGLKSAESGNVFVYPYEEQLVLRSDELYRQQIARTQRSNGKTVYGVKGPSFLSKMLVSSPIRSTSIDIMHSVFLGSMKTLLHLWFDKKNKDCDFSLRECTNIVNNFLLSLKPPHFLQRCPQPLTKLAYWKASEYESFFFFYSLPILSVAMDSVYFNHFLLFYGGVSLLCQDSVCENDIALSQVLLDEFVRKYQDLYGLRHMTYNLHSLRHLPNVVRELGPLWNSMCYLFEGLNGTQFVGLQVKSNFGLATRLSSIIDSCADEALKNFCLEMCSPFKRLNFTERVNELTSVVGPIVKDMVLDDRVRNFLSNVNGNLSFFHKIRFDSCLYFSEAVSTGRKLSSHVLYIHNNVPCYGLILAFLKVTQCQCLNTCKCPAEYYAIIRKFNTENPFSTLRTATVIKPVVKCNQSDVLQLVPVTALRDVVVKVEFNDICYLVSRPYRINLQ